LRGSVPAFRHESRTDHRGDTLGQLVRVQGPVGFREHGQYQQA
jgi:hypothetical protein